ncbi:uncharacterized protein I206_105719 [Kwoniella pini CBS 10737]|uniref:Uncharacterized protein n=1 Tax=Kwoniella pini CBS 10737 TaxID=1296096 RepID=A0A1B9I3G0_9TREE|nr:uncharacterized protein I206_03378 [Kwoniella pini CBS 10737]OCF50062.1 hypothetical protein I206_03378 [Kwoniella pini CBS 10737]
MLNPPLYCSICSLPCTLPRLPIDIPSNLSDIHQINFDPEKWLSVWYIIKLSLGIIDSSKIINNLENENNNINSNYTNKILNLNNKNIESEFESESKSKSESNLKTITIHLYCLKLISKTILKSKFSNGKIHQENQLLNWSIPKWTGYGLWNKKNLTLIEIEKAFIIDDSSKSSINKLNSGYWGGLLDQRKRYIKFGNHLIKDDLISPIKIPFPKSQISFKSNYQKKRLNQISKLPKLPINLIERIIDFILDEPNYKQILNFINNNPQTQTNKSLIIKLINPNSIKTLFSLFQTCSNFYYYYNFEILSSNKIWILLIFDSIKKFNNELIGRWRSNPTGVGSALNLWESLEIDFEIPVKNVIKDLINFQQSQIKFDFNIKSNSFSDDQLTKTKINFDMKDIWIWWNYNLNWKNRRKIWRCVVYATATARDADWW